MIDFVLNKILLLSDVPTCVAEASAGLTLVLAPTAVGCARASKRPQWAAVDVQLLTVRTIVRHTLATLAAAPLLRLFPVGVIVAVAIRWASCDSAFRGFLLALLGWRKRRNVETDEGDEDRHLSTRLAFGIWEVSDEDPTPRDLLYSFNVDCRRVANSFGALCVAVATYKWRQARTLAAIFVVIDQISSVAFEDASAATLLAVSNALASPLWSALVPASILWPSWGTAKSLQLPTGRYVSLVDVTSPGLVIAFMASFDGSYASLAASSYALWVAANIGRTGLPRPPTGSATIAAILPVLAAATIVGDARRMFEFRRSSKVSSVVVAKERKEEEEEDANVSERMPFSTL